MALEQQVVLDDHLEAAENLEAYRGVYIDGNGKAAYPSASTDRIHGVTLRKAEAGEQVQVVVVGIVPIKVGTAGTTAINTVLTAHTDGTFDEGSTNDLGGAIALEAPGADGDIVQAFVSPAIIETIA